MQDLSTAAIEALEFLQEHTYWVLLPSETDPVSTALRGLRDVGIVDGEEGSDGAVTLWLSRDVERRVHRMGAAAAVGGSIGLLRLLRGLGSATRATQYIAAHVDLRCEVESLLGPVEDGQWIAVLQLFNQASPWQRAELELALDSSKLPSCELCDAPEGEGCREGCPLLGCPTCGAPWTWDVDGRTTFYCRCAS